MQTKKTCVTYCLLSIALQVRRQHQAELARQKNEETARRLAAGGSGHGDGQGSAKSTGDITAYRNVDDIPSRELMIQVGQPRDS